MTVPDVKRRADAHAKGRRRVVAVIGSGRYADARCCEEIGRLVAELGFDMLTGGGRGVMEAVARAFVGTSPRRGIAIGIIPGEVDAIEALERREATAVEYEQHSGYPNPWIELAIYTHLPDSGTEGTRRSSRNHINVLSADAIVALPGEAGTESEMWLAVQYGVPIIAFGEHRDAARLHGITHAQTLDEVREFLIRGARAHPEW